MGPQNELSECLLFSWSGWESIDAYAIYTPFFYFISKIFTSEIVGISSQDVVLLHRLFQQQREWKRQSVGDGEGMKANMRRGTGQRPECHNGMQSQHACIMRNAVIPIWPIYNICMYDRLSVVAESWVQWRSDFQSGSRVLKEVSWTFLIYIYGLQCHFIQKNC